MHVRREAPSCWYTTLVSPRPSAAVMQHPDIGRSGWRNCGKTQRRVPVRSRTSRRMSAARKRRQAAEAASRSARDSGRPDFMGSTCVPPDQNFQNAAERARRKKAAMFQRLTGLSGVQQRALENMWRSGREPKRPAKPMKMNDRRSYGPPIYPQPYPLHISAGVLGGSAGRRESYQVQCVRRHTACVRRRAA